MFYKQYPAQMVNLPYGQFFGDHDWGFDLPGFSLSHIKPTLHPEDVPLHGHTQASLIFILKGRYISSADGFQNSCCSGTLIFNPRGTVHRDSFEQPSGRYLALSISDQIADLMDQLPSIPRSATAFRSHRIDGIAARLCRNKDTQAGFGTLDLEAECWQLVSALAGQELWKEFRSDTWLAAARELLHDECCAQICFTEIAIRLGVHPVTLSRGFRKAYKCTPQQYVTRCRLQKALHVMRTTRKPLAAIALESGFFDQSHFSRAFRFEFGIAPHDCRRALRPFER